MSKKYFFARKMRLKLRALGPESSSPEDQEHRVGAPGGEARATAPWRSLV